MFDEAEDNIKESFITGNVHIETKHLGGSLSWAFENMQQFKNLAPFIESSLVCLVSKVVNALKGIKDVVCISSLTAVTAMLPSVITIEAGGKLQAL